ncbi:type II toxin-antitoxin system HicA family toxin [Endozoicomonas sp. ONNA2]|uniref:type II toxin-antitoxin system HicA family toxin n=1 Tax=Endozoicomonas sp. ONNA2 TaxID=2828741 RepID=UPI002147B9AD
MKSRELIKEMEAAGWILDRVKGSHHIYRHPDFKRSIPVPHPRKDLKKGTLEAIRKQAGLK